MNCGSAGCRCPVGRWNQDGFPHRSGGPAPCGRPPDGQSAEGSDAVKGDRVEIVVGARDTTGTYDVAATASRPPCGDRGAPGCGGGERGDPLRHLGCAPRGSWPTGCSRRSSTRYPGASLPGHPRVPEGRRPPRGVRAGPCVILREARQWVRGHDATGGCPLLGWKHTTDAAARCGGRTDVVRGRPGGAPAASQARKSGPGQDHRPRPRGDGGRRTAAVARVSPIPGHSAARKRRGPDGPHDKKPGRRLPSGLSVHAAAGAASVCGRYWD